MNMQTDGTMGERIARARRNRRLSQKELSALIHVESNTISMYENDIRRPSIDVFVLLVGALRVSADYLLFGDSVKVIDATGLEEKETGLLRELAELFREKNGKQ